MDQLGLPRESVNIEILDAGSRGIFGLGGRQARIRLSLQIDETPAAVVEKAVAVETAVQDNKPKPVSVVVPVVTEIEEDLDDDTLQVARTVVCELLERMKVRAQVKAGYSDPQEPNGQPVVNVEIQGDDLSILIGRRSETLNALQYITNLIVGKELGHWVPLTIDVQGYRNRRERQLRLLARRMADQAVHTGRRQVLEPMPANERRVIHLELRDHPNVITESIGDEPTRKVTIYVKK
ncbi:MAG: KH domain-containing protein [Chloroflexi bacterium]|nr:KH domain-containing protein [Chloroflexota bacterium]